MKTKPQSTAAKLAAHAQRLLGRPESAQEHKKLEEQADLEEQIGKINSAADAIGNQKGSETKSLDSPEVRALILPLIDGDVFPKPLKTLAEVAEAVSILCRLHPTLTEQRARIMSGRQDVVKTNLPALQKDLEEVNKELAEIQKKLNA